MGNRPISIAVDLSCVMAQASFADLESTRYTSHTNPDH